MYIKTKTCQTSMTSKRILRMHTYTHKFTIEQTEWLTQTCHFNGLYNDSYNSSNNNNNKTNNKSNINDNNNKRIIKQHHNNKNSSKNNISNICMLLFFITNHTNSISVIFIFAYISYFFSFLFISWPLLPSIQTYIYIFFFYQQK